MRPSTRPRAAAHQGGFTLVELLLVVALVMLLTGAVVFNFSNLMRGNQLEEGTTRLETLMRFARAQAANSGRKVQLVFNNESTNTPSASTGEVRATWEPDPLGQPGCFSDLNDTQCQWHVQDINDLVQVESVKLLDTSSALPANTTGSEDFSGDTNDVASAKPMAPITFYPDGSSDSAEIIVAARSTEEDQRMSVRLVGLTGSISHQLLTPDTDETLGENGLPDRTPMSHRSPVIRDTSADFNTAARSSSAHHTLSSSRMVPDAARSTVGDTNTVDRAE